MNNNKVNAGRRNFLKGAAALGGATLTTSTTLSHAAWEAAREKTKDGKQLAIIGSGMGGVAASWLCDSDWNIDLFESRHKIGGHCDSVSVEYEGEHFYFDLGAEFFHPDTHPLYVSLLEEVGLFNPDNEAMDQTLEAPGSLSIMAMDKDRYTFNSKNTHWNIFTSINFGLYTQYARNFILDDSDYEITLEEWIDSLALSRYFKYDLLLPWMSALIGCNVAQAKKASARSILQTFALAYPQNLCAGATTMNSNIGLGGNLQVILDQCENVNVWTNAGVTGLQKEQGQWYLETEAGTFGPYDQIVVNAPPRFAKNWFSELPFTTEIASILDQFEYFRARLLIHSDPAYMVETDSPQYWCVYNAGIKDGECEGSVWLGGIHTDLPGDQSLFKSWATDRDHDPQNILAERTFFHPWITPQAIRASREIRNWQGYEGIWFSGQFTTGMDLQEAALYSALKVAEQLNPYSPRITALRNRLSERGITDINYDL
ncbi:hypothetical protein TDB9533_00264 [Thalassocella blandensis]|nr:hypothetical protein TDB9533_00264 [Thalassocella blandensis]